MTIHSLKDGQDHSLYLNLLLFSLHCQVYDDDLKPIGHLLSILKYDNNNLDDVNDDDNEDVSEQFNGYCRIGMIADTPIDPFITTIDEPLEYRLMI